MTAGLPLPTGTGFDVDHLPYGVFSRAGEQARVGVRLGDSVVDLAAVLGADPFGASSLNGFLAQGRPAWERTRERLQALLTDVEQSRTLRSHVIPLDEVTLHLPVEVADYVDFYASLEHAANLGQILRPGTEPLQPNWRHLPVGYHGRAGTVVVSGTPVVRPAGQSRPAEGSPPGFGPSTRLDIECELGFVVGAPSRLGEPVPPARFADHVFGVVLLNDWSARDIQAWEYVPLGPFLGKSFATSISPWVTPLAALEAARIAGRAQDPAPLPHLRRAEPWGIDITMSVTLNGHVVSRPPFRGMYWTPDQMLAHMTSNGAALRTGDLYGSGTVSGPERAERGSLVEMTWGGREPLELPDGSVRTFLEDADVVSIGATAASTGGGIIRLGEVEGTVLPARPDGARR